MCLIIIKKNCIVINRMGKGSYGQINLPSVVMLVHQHQRQSVHNRVRRISRRE